MKKRVIAAAALLLSAAAPAPETSANPPEWTEPTAPFRIAGNIYYVGAKGIAAYLITTPRGAILLDGTMPENVALVEGNIRALGVKLGDVKILLNSHAHFDHAGGLAGISRDTGAKLAAMAQDVGALESGRHVGLTSYRRGMFPAVKVDRVLHDGDTVQLGGVTMTALLTSGHTKGCTTWTMTVRLRAGMKQVVFPCSMSVAGNLLVGNSEYPGIVADFRKTFDRIGALKADIVLPAHPERAEVLTRRGPRFIDPTLLGVMVSEARAAFDTQLAKETTASAH